MNILYAKIIATCSLIVAIFFAGATWEHKRNDNRQAVITANQFRDYKETVATEIQTSTATNTVIVAEIATSQKQQVQTKEAALGRIRNQLKPAKAQNETISPVKYELPQVNDAPVQAACPDPGPFYFDIGTVRLFNYARSNVPDPATASGVDAESAAPSTIGIEALVSNDLDIVRQYHELAKRHDGLVDYVNAKQKPLSETLIPKQKVGTGEQCVEDLRRLAIANPETVISRNYYRVNGLFAESVWSTFFGTFEEFKRQAGLKLSRQQHAHERNTAKHASVDHYRQVGIDRLDYADKYTRDSARRFKTLVVASDLHDKEVDPFFLRVLLDTVERVQPDNICLGGDIFDLAEFGKYTTDPREWDIVGAIKFAHEEILGPLREVAPEAQIDLVEGNHEARLLRHMADATPALRAVLADLHGFTIGRLLGLDKFEINYVAAGDLAAWTVRDQQKELAKNYKTYYDSFLCHHFPYAKSMGLPGVNGHHHRHVVWSEFSPIYGAYEWHQLGAGHKRSASYCEGEKWHNGFAIVNIDTSTRAVNFDYVPVTDFAVSGGKWYLRHASEAVPSSKIGLTSHH